MKSFHVHSNFSLEGWGCNIHTQDRIKIYTITKAENSRKHILMQLYYGR